MQTIHCIDIRKSLYNKACLLHRFKNEKQNVKYSRSIVIVLLCLFLLKNKGFKRNSNC